MPKEIKQQQTSMSEVHSELYKSGAWTDQGRIRGGDVQFSKVQSVAEGSKGQALANTLGVVNKAVGSVMGNMVTLSNLSEADEAKKAKYRARFTQYRNDYKAQLSENRGYLDLPEDQRDDARAMLKRDLHEMYFGDMDPTQFNEYQNLYNSVEHQVGSYLSAMDRKENQEIFLGSNVHTVTAMVEDQVDLMLGTEGETKEIRDSISAYYNNNIKGSQLDVGRDAFTLGVIGSLRNKAIDYAEQGYADKAQAIVDVLKEQDSSGISWSTAMDSTGKLKYGNTIEELETTISTLNTQRKESTTKAITNSTLVTLNKLNDLPTGPAKITEATKVKDMILSNAGNYSQAHLKDYLENVDNIIRGRKEMPSNLNTLNQVNKHILMNADKLTLDSLEDLIPFQELNTEDKIKARNKLAGLIKANEDQPEFKSSRKDVYDALLPELKAQDVLGNLTQFSKTRLEYFYTNFNNWTYDYYAKNGKFPTYEEMLQRGKDIQTYAVKTFTDGATKAVKDATRGNTPAGNKQHVMSPELQAKSKEDIKNRFSKLKEVE